MQQAIILTILFFYCRQGSITPELQERLYALDMTTILKYADVHLQLHWWRKVSVFLNFIIWLEDKVSIMSKLTLFHLLTLMQPFSEVYKALHSYFLETVCSAINSLSPKYSGLMRHYASIILTFPLKIYAFTNSLGTDVTVSFPALFADYALLDTPVDMLNHLSIAVLTPTSDSLFDSHDSTGVILEETTLKNRSLQLLCHILNPSPMDDNGQYYADRSQYTNLAQMMAEKLSVKYVCLI